MIRQKAVSELFLKASGLDYVATHLQEGYELTGSITEILALTNQLCKKILKEGIEESLHS